MDHFSHLSLKSGISPLHAEVGQPPVLCPQPSQGPAAAPTPHCPGTAAAPGLPGGGFRVLKRLILKITFLCLASSSFHASDFRTRSSSAGVFQASPSSHAGPQLSVRAATWDFPTTWRSLSKLGLPPLLSQGLPSVFTRPH